MYPNEKYKINLLINENSHLTQLLILTFIIVYDYIIVIWN